MNKFNGILAIATLFVSCASHENNPSEKNKNQALPVADYLIVEKDSVTIPSFQVEINMSPAANGGLVHDKETFIIHTWFSGLPKDSSSKEYIESGEMLLRSKKTELANNNLIRFEGLKFSRAKYDSLAGKDISVLINIYSGRHSSPDNILDCDILADKMSNVKGKKIMLACKLIGEQDSLQTTLPNEPKVP